MSTCIVGIDCSMLYLRNCTQFPLEVLRWSWLAVAGVALLASLANWLYIEPVATDLMFQRYALENAEGERDAAKIKQLYKQFGKFHGISSLANLVALGAAMSHGWWLASRLSLGLA
jgi:hypothetical protein